MSRLRVSLPLLLLASVLLPALVPAQRVVAWGYDSDGQCDIPAGLIATQVAAGDGFSLALRPSGTVAGWGDNSFGERRAPAGLVATQVAAGGAFSLALRTDGTVAAWGYNGDGQCDVPAGLVARAVAAGEYHSLALRPDGTVTAWGYNHSGECDVPAGLVATQVAGGFAHSLALRSDGTVVAWGDDLYHQCDVPTGLMAKEVSAGDLHSLALRSNGSVAVWGNNSKGQRNAPAGLVAIQVSAGAIHNLALRPDGTVAAWGDNEYHQCDVPSDLTGVLQVSAGGDFSLALVAAAHCVLDQKQVYAGDSATGTVKLAQPAPAGGTVVGLSCDQPTVHVPDSVTVPEGAVTATFPVFTDEGTVNLTATIQTSYNNTATVPAKLAVRGYSASLTMGRPALYGGSTASETATLSLAHALPADITFDLASSDPSVTVPAQVTVRAGKTSVSFNAAHMVVPDSRRVQIVASRNGTQAASAAFTVNPIAGTLALSPTDLHVGGTSQGTVTLNAPVAQPLTVALTTAHSFVSIPTSATVLAGGKTATFVVTVVGQIMPLTEVVSATVNGRASRVTLHIFPNDGVTLVELPWDVEGQQYFTGRVLLGTPAPAGGWVVDFSSSDPSVRAATSVTIPEGASYADFSLVSSDVAVATLATITATGGGSSTSTSMFVRPLTVHALALAATTVKGGDSVDATVTLDVSVGVNTAVSVESSDPSVVIVPSTTTVVKGGASRTFTVRTKAVTAAKTVRITVTKNGTSAYRTLKVTP